MKLPPALLRHTFAPTLRILRGVLEHAEPEQLRAWAARTDEALGMDLSGLRQRELALPHCRARWFEIEAARAERVLLYLHGGAFITETPGLHGGLLAWLCQATQCQGLMPSYRLAPEHRFPAAPDDCLDAYRWLLAQGYQGRNIVLAGDSAGGNLALGLLPRLRDAGLSLPLCVIALSPLTDCTLSGGSITRNNGLDPMFNTQAMHRLAPVYLPDEAARRDPLASPLLAELQGLPPLLLQVGSSELLLDDSLRFAVKYPGAQLQVWHDMPHVFPLYHFLPEALQARQQMADFVNAQFASAGRDAARESTPGTAPEPAPLPPPPAQRPAPLPGWAGLLLAAAAALAAISCLHWAA
ncbi:acetyl esterase/lipase [Paucibacter oligotrophus]|uniref:Acetyl esterase/lipase n=1 Tax=Roseateles oligotrophus TaxID=1769250 RepID=A0A840LAC7_9BURK|nr:alpha/beta hydrolase [Roseateles oligotrophus]MBB4843683.1 acetyl esterase/lipase [Roseateles oligotrophus]